MQRFAQPRVAFVCELNKQVELAKADIGPGQVSSYNIVSFFLNRIIYNYYVFFVAGPSEILDICDIFENFEKSRIIKTFPLDGFAIFFLSNAPLANL